MYRLRKDRLGEDGPDLLDNCPAKPRWMRWRTYWQLAAMDEALEEKRFAQCWVPSSPPARGISDDRI